MKSQSEGKLQTWDLILCDSQAVNLLNQALSYHLPLAGQNQAFVVGGWPTRMPSARQQKGPLWWKRVRAWNSGSANVRAWILTALQRSSSPSPCGAQNFPAASPTASGDLDAAPEWPTRGETQVYGEMQQLDTTGYNWLLAGQAKRIQRIQRHPSSLLSKTQRKHENMAHWLYHVVLNRHDRQTSLVLQPSQWGSAETPEKIGPPPRFQIYFRSPLLGLTVSLFERPYICYLLWMEEILHQLVDGLSHCNPIMYSVL